MYLLVTCILFLIFSNVLVYSADPMYIYENVQFCDLHTVFKLLYMTIIITFYIEWLIQNSSSQTSQLVTVILPFYSHNLFPFFFFNQLDSFYIILYMIFILYMMKFKFWQNFWRFPFFFFNSVFFFFLFFLQDLTMILAALLYYGIIDLGFTV